MTTEDILPPKLYARAVKAYFAMWHPDAYSQKQAEIDGKLDDEAFGANGLVADTRAIAKELIHADRNNFDKMGVLQEAIRIIRDADSAANDVPELDELEKRLRKFCDGLRRVIERSEQAERRETGKQAIVRVIREFFIRHRESATVYDVERLIVRLESEAELFGEDGASLGECLRRLKEDARKLRAADQERLTGDEWDRWRSWITAIRKDPLEVDLRSPEMDSEAEANTQTDGGPGIDMAQPQHSPSSGTVTARETKSAKLVGDGQGKKAE